MSFESDSKRGVLNHFGPRKTNGEYGGKVNPDLLKYAVIDIDVPNGEGIAAAAWAVEGLDVVIPSGAIFLTADLVVETAFDALTGLNIGTYLASDGTTAVDADGFMVAATVVLAAIDAVGDRIKGAGAQLATGTGGLGALTSNAVIRTLYTGTAPTVGKARLIVSYLSPTP